MITGYENLAMLAIIQAVEDYEDYIDNYGSDVLTDEQVTAANHVADATMTKIEKIIRILREEQESENEY